MRKVETLASAFALVAISMTAQAEQDPLFSARGACKDDPNLVDETICRIDDGRFLLVEKGEPTALCDVLSVNDSSSVVGLAVSCDPIEGRIVVDPQDPITDGPVYRF